MTCNCYVFFVVELPYIRTFIVSSISSNSIKLIFEQFSSKRSGASLSYQVEQQVKNSTDWAVAESSVESSDDHIVVILVKKLEPETQYRFRVVAVLHDNGQTFHGIASEPSVYHKTKSGDLEF